MILALTTKTPMKYLGAYLMNIYSCFVSFERGFPQIFLILQFRIRKKIIQESRRFLDLAKVSVTKVSSVKEDDIKIKKGVYI